MVASSGIKDSSGYSSVAGGNINMTAQLPAETAKVFSQAVAEIYFV